MDSKEAKVIFLNWYEEEMIRDEIPLESITAYMKTFEMIVAEEVLNPDSAYAAKKFIDLRERGRHALPWHMSDEKFYHRLDVIEYIQLRHREIKHSESFKDRIGQLMIGMSPNEIDMAEAVARGYWN